MAMPVRKFLREYDRLKFRIYAFFLNNGHEFLFRSKFFVIKVLHGIEFGFFYASVQKPFEPDIGFWLEERESQPEMECINYRKFPFTA